MTRGPQDTKPGSARALLFRPAYQTGTLVCGRLAPRGPSSGKSKRPRLPDNIWFTMEILARGKHILIMANGKTVSRLQR